MAKRQTLRQRIARWAWWAMAPLDGSGPVGESRDVASYGDARERVALAVEGLRQSVRANGMDASHDAALAEYDEAVAALRAALTEQWRQPAADAPCPACGGRGWYPYSEDHCKPCERCCNHADGWWVLTEYHAGYVAGADNGCCRAGCGRLRRDLIAHEAGNA